MAGVVAGLGVRRAAEYMTGASEAILGDKGRLGCCYMSGSC